MKVIKMFPMEKAVWDLLNGYIRFNDGDVITMEVLKEKGIIKKELSGLKVLGNGELTKKITVKANRFSSKAVTKIETASELFYIYLFCYYCFSIYDGYLSVCN